MTKNEITMTVAIQRAKDVYKLTLNTNDGELQYKAEEAYNYLVYEAMNMGYSSYPMDEKHNREILRAQGYDCRDAYWLNEE